MNRLQHQDTIGFDLSLNGLRYVHLERSGSGTLHCVRSGILNDAEAGYAARNNLSGLADYLSRIAKEQNLPLRKATVWFCLNQDRAKVYYLTLPRMPSKQLLKAVYWAVQKEEAFEPQTTQLDYQIEAEDDAACRVMAYLVPKADIEAHRQICRALEIRRAGLVLPLNATRELLRSLPHSEEPDATQAITHIDDTSSRILITRSGLPQLVRSIPFGFQNLYKDDGRTALDQTQAVGVINRMARQIQRTIEFHQSSSNNYNTLPGITLAGALNENEHWMEMLESEVGLTLFRPDPASVRNLDNVVELPADPPQRLALATAFGAALCGLRSEAQNLLLPVNERFRQGRRRRIEQGLMALYAVALLGMAVLYGTQLRALNQAKADLRKAEHSLQTLGGPLNFNELMAEVVATRGQLRQLHSDAHKATAMAELRALSQSAQQAGLQLQLMEIDSRGTTRIAGFIPKGRRNDLHNLHNLIRTVESLGIYGNIHVVEHNTSASDEWEFVELTLIRTQEG